MQIREFVSKLEEQTAPERAAAPAPAAPSSNFWMDWLLRPATSLSANTQQHQEISHAPIRQPHPQQQQTGVIGQPMKNKNLLKLAL